MPNSETWYVIQYRHDDCKVSPGVEWEDEWSCACNSECPACGVKDIEPISWEEIGDEAQQTADDLLTRIGQRIYDAYNIGALPYDIAEASLETLDQLTGDNLWLGMPIIPEPAD